MVQMWITEPQAENIDDSLDRMDGAAIVCESRGERFVPSARE